MESKAAIISDCGKFRFVLTRIWNDNAPLVGFIMLNPSKADHREDDPTIRKCKTLAKNWGFGGLMVCNLFPFRATNPKELLAAEDPTGGDYILTSRNARTIEQLNRDCEKTVFAWGNTPIVKKLFTKFPEYRPLPSLTQNACYLTLLKDGAPGHPLFLRGNTLLHPYPFKPVFDYLQLENELNTRTNQSRGQA